LATLRRTHKEKSGEFSQALSTVSAKEAAVAGLKTELEWLKVAREIAAANDKLEASKKEVARHEAAREKTKKAISDKRAQERRLKENAGGERKAKLKEMEEQIADLKKKIKDIKDAKQFKSLRDSIAALKREENVSPSKLLFFWSNNTVLRTSFDNFYRSDFRVLIKATYFSKTKIFVQNNTVGFSSKQRYFNNII
jgi:predicted  nucleic acid-binding Zn-ribbon protein